MTRLDAQSDPELVALAEEARNYLQQHSWCARVRELWFADGWPGILGVFLAETEPLGEADERVWVVVGDCPPVYLESAAASDATEVLQRYVALFREWVTAVEEGEPVNELVPASYRGSLRPVEATRENASSLARRLDFIEETLIPESRKAPL